MENSAPINRGRGAENGPSDRGAIHLPLIRLRKERLKVFLNRPGIFLAALDGDGDGGAHVLEVRTGQIGEAGESLLDCPQGQTSYQVVTQLKFQTCHFCLPPLICTFIIHDDFSFVKNFFYFLSCFLRKFLQTLPHSHHQLNRQDTPLQRRSRA